MQTFLKPLSPAEEAQYLKLLHGEDEEAAFLARDKLIMHNLRLVAHIARKYQGPGQEAEDYISIGILGLLKAIDTFDAGRGKLATYACRCIENELLMMLRTKKKFSREVSLYEPMGTDKEGNEIQIIDACTQDEDMTADAEERETLTFLTQALNSVLTEKEKEILTMRYGLNGGRVYTQSQVGEHFQISRSYVSRLEKKALEKLRRVFREAEYL
ncbi:MAG: sigma-70 family RNA polymerase sigma factor [Lachnospiraceae bacterium]|nr:sigma-70 family RNA polymerase sigma factor [Lachnospiraceae bacterium]